MTVAGDRGPTLAEINGRLADDALEFCRYLVKLGHLDGEPRGRLWRCLQSDKGGRFGDSLSIELQGSKAGTWNHASVGQGGRQLVGLVMYLAQCKPAEAVDVAKAFLGIEDGRPLPPPKPRPAGQVSDADRDAKRLERARTVWRECQPAPGTLAETYLRSRGIKSAVPLSLRFHPSLWHDFDRRRWPALVGGVQNGAGELVGVWRIYLAHDGRGKALVADDPGPKLGLGPTRGGAVRLGPLAGDQVVVCEGVETGMAICDLGWPSPVWACLHAGGLSGVQLPDAVREVVIVPDYDYRDLRPELVTRRPDGQVIARPNPHYGKRPGIAAAERAKARFEAEGRRVCIMRPHTEGMDFNDVVKRAG